MQQPNNHSTAQNPVGRFMVAVGAIIEHAETHKILIIQRTASLDWQAGKWELLYGRIDQFEDAQTGLRREVSEETGITDLEIGEALRVWHIFRGPELVDNELIGITFHCITHQDAVTISAEHDDYAWVTPEEAFNRTNVEGVKEDVRNYMKKMKRVGNQSAK